MEFLDEHAANVFTDGSSLPRPRRGGYAFLVVTVGEDGHEVVDEFSPNGCAGANNQEMELKACVEALKLLASRRSPVDLGRYSKIFIYTDSAFVHKHFDTAKFQWSANRWMRQSGPPVMHAHLWKELVGLVTRIDRLVYIEWVKGKSSTPNASTGWQRTRQSDRLIAPPACAAFDARGRRGRLSLEASPPKVR